MKYSDRVWAFGSFLIFASLLLCPLSAISQSSGDIGGVAPKIAVGGGYTDDIQSSPRGSGGSAGPLDTGAMDKMFERERVRFGGGQDIVKQKAKPKTAEEILKEALSLEEVPITEGVDITTEALDAIFFRDIARQQNLTYQELFETAGYIERKTQSVAEIIDAEPGNQRTFSAEDIIYINKGTANGIVNGMEFAVLKVSERDIDHPISRNYLGHLVTMEGLVKVLDASTKISRAKVIKAYNALERGDLLVPYEKRLLPSFDPDRPVEMKEIEGVIVGSRDPKSGYATGDIVFIDAGEESGVKIGDSFDIIDTRSVVRNDGRIVMGIPKIIGKAKVINVRPDTSTTIISKCVTAIYKGDKVEFAP